jgi:hypothetical protein
MSRAGEPDGPLPPATAILADFAAQLRGADLPASITDSLGHLLLDYLRVASTGADMPWSAWSRDYMGALNRNGASPVLFGGRPVSDWLPRYRRARAAGR